MTRQQIMDEINRLETKAEKLRTLEDRVGPECLTFGEKIDLCFYVEALNELYRDLTQCRKAHHTGE